MEKKHDGHIVVMLSNKGYVAIENNQIFQLWKNRCLKDIYEELQFRYPSFKVSLGSLECINFKDIVEVCNQYIKQEEQPESLIITEESEKPFSKSIIKSNKVLETGIIKMKTKRKVKIKAATVIGINVTAGVLHLGFQSMADLVCYSEAKLIDRLNVFDKTVEEIMNARKAKTLESQQYLLKSPKKVKEKANQFYCRVKDIKNNAEANYKESFKTV